MASRYGFPEHCFLGQRYCWLGHCWLDLDQALFGAVNNNRAMSLLQTLRNTPWLAKCALLWLALTLGVAVASPMVDPQEELVICTTAGMLKIKIHADGSLSSESSSEAACPLCVVGSALPLAFASALPEPVQALAHVLPGIPAAHIAVATAAPPPSRAPPVTL